MPLNKQESVKSFTPPSDFSAGVKGQIIKYPMLSQLSKRCVQTEEKSIKHFKWDFSLKDRDQPLDGPRG